MISKERVLKLIDDVMPCENDYRYNHMKEIENYINQSPTSEEVCKALSEYYEWEVKYDKGYYYVFVHTKWMRVEMGDLVGTPHLITMIGQFYETLNR